MKVIRTALWALLLLPLASPAFAVIWYEADHAPEAGHTIASAQLPGSSTTAIHGTFADRLDGHGGYEFVDVDMYRIRIDNTTTFKAETWSYHADPFAETSLYLFNADGTGVVFNQDYEEFIYGAQITNDLSLGLGLSTDVDYYLAVSRAFYIPLDSNGDWMWDEIGGNFWDQKTPLSPAAVLGSWYGELWDGPPVVEYEIRLTGARGTDTDMDPIPEPSAMAILLLGGGLLLVRRFCS